MCRHSQTRPPKKSRRTDLATLNHADNEGVEVYLSSSSFEEEEGEEKEDDQTRAWKGAIRGVLLAVHKSSTPFHFYQSLKGVKETVVYSVIGTLARLFGRVSHREMQTLFMTAGIMKLDPAKQEDTPPWPLQQAVASPPEKEIPSNEISSETYGRPKGLLLGLGRPSIPETKPSFQQQRKSKSPMPGKSTEENKPLILSRTVVSTSTRDKYRELLF